MTGSNAIRRRCGPDRRFLSARSSAAPVTADTTQPSAARLHRRSRLAWVFITLSAEKRPSPATDDRVTDVAANMNQSCLISLVHESM